MKPFPDVIQELIEGLNYTVKINSIVDNLDGTFTLFACSTLHVRNHSLITIGGTDYRVTEVINNVSIAFTAPSTPTGSTFTAKKPFYIHGSLLAANTELNKIIDADEKLPMVYLFESFSEERVFNKKSPIQRNVRTSLYVLDSADFNNWLTDDHYEKAVKPMDNLAELIVETIDKDGKYGFVDTYNITPMVRFGQITENGNTKLLFDEFASGVLLEITIPIMKPIKCDKNNLC